MTLLLLCHRVCVGWMCGRVGVCVCVCVCVCAVQDDVEQKGLRLGDRFRVGVYKAALRLPADT